jgi:hypothetical protein
MSLLGCSTGLREAQKNNGSRKNIPFGAMGTRLHLARRLDAATEGTLEQGLDYIGEEWKKGTMLLEAARCPQGGVFSTKD